MQLLRYSLAATAAATIFSAVVFVALESRAEGAAEDWPLEELAEPSGIVFHPLRGSLFVCSDEGDVAEVSLDGKLLTRGSIGGDLEAITVHPVTGRLFVVREGHEILLEFRPEDFKLTRRWNIQRGFGERPEYLARGGNGIEGLTFVADQAHPEGGRFFAVNQDDPPVLVELAVPLESMEGKFGEATVRAAYEVETSPLSGLLWHEPAGAFVVPSAPFKQALVLDRKGRILRRVTLPGIMQEGIAAVPGGAFVLVQDIGGLVKWSPAGDPFSGGPDNRKDTGGEED